MRKRRKSYLTRMKDKSHDYDDYNTDTDDDDYNDYDSELDNHHFYEDESDDGSAFNEDGEINENRRDMWSHLDWD